MFQQFESRLTPSGARVAAPVDHAFPAGAPFDQHPLQAHLRPVELKRGQLLHRAGDLVDQVYFLRGGLVRQFDLLADGKAAGMLLGAGAAVGLHAALRNVAASGEVVVLLDGPAYRISSAALGELTERAPAIAHAALLCLAEEAALLHQHVACCVNHLTEGRLASLLLRTADQTGKAVLPLTQEDLAALLGIQRTTVTAIASHLREEGTISYVRGTIRILDPERLQALSCGCFDGKGPRTPRYAARAPSASEGRHAGRSLNL